MAQLSPASADREDLIERSRPKALDGITVKAIVGTGDKDRPVANLYVQVNVDERLRPFEVFLRLGHSDPAEQAHLEGQAKAISYALRIGGSLEEIANDMIGVAAYPIAANGGFTRSAQDAMGKVFLDVSQGRYNAHFERARALRGRSEERFQERLPAFAPLSPAPSGAYSLASSGSIAPELGKRGAAGAWRDCPECGCAGVASTEGCMVCYLCGWSKC